MKSLLITFTTLFVFFSLTNSYAQEVPDPENPTNANLEVPAKWEVRLDNPTDNLVISSKPDSGDIYFVNMIPGWHITTGPRAIFWHPGSTTNGDYRAETSIHLFDPEGRNEAFGLFFGGQNLKADNYSYIYFLIRNSGEYLVKKRMGDETQVIKNWSQAPSMNRYTEDTESSVNNSLAVEVESNTISFYVNGELVHSMAKADWQTDGIVGLRINHRLNVHIEDLNVNEE